MRALLIEFNLRTGERAGGINPKDPKLPCYGWQNLESTPALEIRLVEDERDLSKLVGIKGITILEGREEINQAIQANIPAIYSVKDMALMLEHMRQKQLPVDRFAGKSMAEIAKEAHDLGLAGVTERKPESV